MTIRSFLEHHSPNVLKILFYNSKYRQPLNINESQINNAVAENRQNWQLLQKIATYCQTEHIRMKQIMASETNCAYFNLACTTFENDLNSANIMTVVHDVRKKISKYFQQNQTFPFGLIKEY